MNRLLVVAYYTPPLGLSGVMRITKLCKFLPDFGWEPIILTVKPVAYYGYDENLLNELHQAQIFRTESLDPNRLLRILQNVKGKSGKEKGERELGNKFNWASGARLLNFILLPDAKVGWIPFAIREGKRLIQALKPKAVFATAPPWSALLIGLKLAQKGNLPFIADFRDPWPAGFQTPPIYQRPFLKKMLKRIFACASLVLAVNKGTAKRISPSAEQEITILENGFDPDEFMVVPEKLQGFSILYLGNLYENQKEIADFLSALEHLSDVRFYLAGNVDRESQKLLQANKQVTLFGKVPHSRAIALMKGADALLYIGKPQQPVGLKLYEYLGANKPIIVWGEGAEEAVELVKELAAGSLCTDTDGLERTIQEIKENPDRFCEKDRSRFNRRNQAEWLALRLKSLL